MHPVGVHSPSIEVLTVPTDPSLPVHTTFCVPTPPIRALYPSLLDVLLVYYCETEIIGLCGAVSFYDVAHKVQQTIQLGAILVTAQSRRITLNLPHPPAPHSEVLLGRFEACVTLYPPECHTASEAVFLAKIVAHLREVRYRGSAPMTSVQAMAKGLPMYTNILHTHYQDCFSTFIRHHSPHTFQYFSYTEDEIERHRLVTIHAREPRVALAEDRDIYIAQDEAREQERTQHEAQLFRYVEQMLREEGPCDATLLMMRLSNECEAFNQILYPSITVLTRVLMQHPELFTLRDDAVSGVMVYLQKTGMDVSEASYPLYSTTTQPVGEEVSPLRAPLLLSERGEVPRARSNVMKRPPSSPGTRGSPSRKEEDHAPRSNPRVSGNKRGRG